VIAALQGVCSKAAPEDITLAQPPVHSQCVLRVQERLFRNNLGTSGHVLWLDNVYVRAERRPAGDEVRTVLWQGGVDPAAPPSKLWITNSIFEGNQANSSAIYIQDASVYIAGQFTLKRAGNVRAICNNQSIVVPCMLHVNACNVVSCMLW
jgi:hypothetical protein